MCPAVVSPVLAVSEPWYLSSLLLAAVGVAWLVLAYRWYGRRLARRLIAPTDAPTPAVAQYDGVDYCPARPVVLFGHHFASIAGAGPIIGPILAVAAFGWAPTVLWIFLGVVLIGGVHDYLALMISVRNRGNSLPDVARDTLGGSARVLFLTFVWIGLVLVITSFCSVTTDTFLSAPEIVFPTFALMLIAILFGVLTYRVGLKTWQGTLIALALMALAIWIGFLLPIDLEKLGVPKASVRSVWLFALLGYGLIASVVPVWILLQPRDYLSTWILIGGMLAGFVGIVWVHPTLKAPSFTAVTGSQGPLWPIMFITVACGAVSGFHCLVAGGTTSKQLAKEKHGLAVGYGAMLTEGALAIMALVAVAAGLYFASADAVRGGAPGELSLISILGQEKGGGAIAAFGRGFDVLTDPFLGRLGRALNVQHLGMIAGILMVNAFVLTTLDTTVRLARFITHELAARRVPALRNRWLASLLPVVAAYALAVQKSAFGSLWKVFGAANQLIAALALIVISGYLMKRGKSTRYTVLPALFMLVTTMAALVWLAYQHLVEAEMPNYTLGVTSIVLLALAVLLAYQGRRALFGLRGPA